MTACATQCQGRAASPPSPNAVQQAAAPAKEVPAGLLAKADWLQDLRPRRARKGASRAMPTRYSAASPVLRTTMSPCFPAQLATSAPALDAPCAHVSLPVLSFPGRITCVQWSMAPVCVRVCVCVFARAGFASSGIRAGLFLQGAPRSVSHACCAAADTCMCPPCCRGATTVQPPITQSTLP